MRVGLLSGLLLHHAQARPESVPSYLTHACVVFRSSITAPLPPSTCAPISGRCRSKRRWQSLAAGQASSEIRCPRLLIALHIQNLLRGFASDKSNRPATASRWLPPIRPHFHHRPVAQHHTTTTTTTPAPSVLAAEVLDAVYTVVAAPHHPNRTHTPGSCAPSL